MPLHGKIVVIKRSGGDGTEFPLTASCLFGRKPDCDIRIQLPQVSKEHCRIDLNENKEVVLTNLSSVNPTRVNGEVLQQSERLKDGDVITIIDRSFRFEYPPAPTPKKRSSAGGKTEKLKVLQDQQVGDVITETGENLKSEASADPHLKDGTNNDNIQRSLEKTAEVEPKQEEICSQSKTSSPFGDLYQMIKQSLDAKTPRKSASSLLQTPTSRFYTPKPGSVRKEDGKPVISSAIKGTSEKVDDDASSLATVTEGDAELKTTPKSAKMRRRSLQGSASEVPGLLSEEKPAEQSGAAPAQKRVRASPQRFTANEVIEIVTAEKPTTTPTRRRSKEATPVKPAASERPPEASPKVTQKKTKDQDVPTDVVATTATINTRKRKSGELARDSPKRQAKRKRVSFGGHLSPELFDKRLPPDSPLRKGAAPRRSLCLSKPKHSLLRRASVIGLVKEEDGVHKSPKVRSPAKKKPQSARAKSPSPSPGKKSPKSKASSPKTPSPGKRSPKARTPSPKASSPGQKPPKSKTPSPKTPSPARGKSPSKDKAETPKVHRKSTASVQAPLASKETPTARRRSSSAASTPAKTPAPIQTPTVRGRFSVSRVSTPSPAAREDAVVDAAPSVAVTPKLPLKRRSMKSASRKTPGIASAVKAMRKSGVSRASMKVKNSWADIVKFGPTKFQVAAPSKKAAAAAAKTTKKAAPKMQTPARSIQGHVSTGHADSPVTIIVGKAHKQTVTCPAGAAPRLLANTAVVKKNLRMDEDLSGVAEIFQTPVNERSRKSVIDDQSSTPLGAPATPAVEASLLKTPEEPGEMIVSPLTVASAVKYSSEAVKRLLHGDEESFVGEITSSLIPCDESSERQRTDLETPGLTSPNQKSEAPECLTAVKKITRTPRQKSEPLEDLRGKILKTPKQKPEQEECRLTGVKRMMKTPRQKVEPVEDLRGKLLATPKQKPEQPECLTGVKRIFNTPTQNSEAVEDLRGNVLETPKAPEVADVSFGGVKELAETPTHKRESAEMTDNLKTPDVKSSPPACLTGIKRLMKTPREKNAPVEDMVGVKRLMMTPTEKGEPVEENFGIKRLMQSPRVKGNPPVEDFEGLQELMEEPRDPTAQEETDEVEDQAPLDCDSDEVKDLHRVCEEQQQQRDVARAHSEDGPSDITDDVPQDVTAIVLGADAEVIEVGSDEKLEEAPGGGENECESSDVVEIISQTAEEGNVPEEQPEVEAEGKVTETDAANVDPDTQKKSGRGRRGKVVESKPEDQQEAAERSGDPDVVAPVRGRRGKRMEAAAPPAVRQTTQSRKPKANESKDAELTQEASEPAPSRDAVKPRRGRNTKKASDDQTETAAEVTTEAPTVPSLDSAAPQEEAASKPKRGRKAKQASVEQTRPAPEQQDARDADGEAQPADITADPPQAEQEEDANEVCGEKLKDVPSGHEANESHAVETAPQAAVDESVTPGEDAASVDANAQKKSMRGRKAQTARTDCDKLEEAERPEEPVVAPARGRRGKKTEASAPLPVRQTTRGRKAKCEEATDAELTQEQSDAPKPKRGRNAKQSSDDPAETAPEVPAETKLVPEISSESDPTPSVNASPEEENDSSPPDEAVSKPKRGRKTRQASVEQPAEETTEIASDQPQRPVVAAETQKPRRGRKAKLDSVEQNEVTVECVAAMQQARAPTRTTRGRNAKQEEETNPDDGAVKTTKSQKPVEKPRRTRKAEKDAVESTEADVLTAETPDPENTEVSDVASKAEEKEAATSSEEIPAEPQTSAPTAETVTVSEAAPAVVADRPRRGGRQRKQEAERVAPVEPPEAQENPIVNPAQKPKRGRGRQNVLEDIAEASEEKPEQVQEAEENKDAEAPVSKPSRARGAKASAKNVDSEGVPPKRVCRGSRSVPQEASVTAESVEMPVAPPKRGRRAATKPTNDTQEVLSTEKPSEDDVNAEPAPAEVKKTVKWNTEFQELEITNPTPVKATRGRKVKLADQDALQSAPAKRGRRCGGGTESTTPAESTSAEAESESANMTEEKDLSGKAGSEPIRRARRGAKAAERDEEPKTLPGRRRGNGAQAKAETQTVTRKRSAKK